MLVARKTIVYLRLVVLSLIIFQSLLLMGNIGLVHATEPRLIEADESISPFPTLSGITNILLSSPMRIGNTGGGGNDWVAVNAQYNQPRSSSTIHLGVDLRSWINNTPNNRPLFSTGVGIIWYIRTALDDTYGRYIGVQNQYREIGVTYEFQTFYAHLRDIGQDATLGREVTASDPVLGRTGGSGTTENQYAIHLHLEFKTPTSGTAGANNLPPGSRSYPPSFFYHRLTQQGSNWGNDTSFINRGATSGNTVNFRIVDIAVGHVLREVPVSNVGLIFRIQGSGTWYGGFGNMTKNGHIFSFNFYEPWHPPGTVFEYYIQAKSNTWDNASFLTAYRPYRYANGNPPSTLPSKLFTHTLTSSTSGATAQASPWYVEFNPDIIVLDTLPSDFFVKEADFLKAVVIERVVSNHSVVVREIEERFLDGRPKLGRRISLSIPKSSEGFGDFIVGREYMMVGKITNLNPLTVLVPKGDYLRPLINEGFDATP